MVQSTHSRKREYFKSMKLSKTLMTAATIVALTTLSTGSVLASGKNSTCQIVYGGGEVCEPSISFSIDKKVQSPTKGGVMVDNLTINDAKFAPGQQITYQIIITNTGEDTLKNVVVKDILPEHLSYVSGAGNYNDSDRTVTYTINELGAGDSNTQTLVLKANDANTLPQDSGIVCVVNTARATEESGSSAEDKAEACIQKEVTTTPQKQVFETPPVKKIPETGPELLSLALLVPSGIAGYVLRRKTSA